MYKSYKERRQLYKDVIKNRDKYSKKDIYIANGTTKDFTLSINDVADILGYVREHVQNYILKELDVCDLVHIEENDYRADARLYMNNNRLQKCISKSSVERYISSSLKISSRHKVVEILKDSDVVKELREILGKRAKIQEVLNDAGAYLDKKYNADELIKNRKARLERLKTAAINGDVDYNALNYIETSSVDVAEIVNYYNRLEHHVDNKSFEDLFDILTFNMYSIKEIKEKLKLKHTMQVYRYINKVSHIAIKFNDSEYEESNKKLSDRNIRYIITNENFNLTKGVYRLPLDYYVYQKLDSMTQINPGFLSVEDIINKEIIDFAEANKDKYMKKEEEQDENE